MGPIVNGSSLGVPYGGGEFSIIIYLNTALNLYLVNLNHGKAIF